MLDIQDFPGFRIPAHVFESVQNNLNHLDNHKLPLDSCGNWCDEEESRDQAAQMARHVSLLLAEVLRRVGECPHFKGGRLAVPPGLTDRVARDVAALAEDEPCGIRGCVLDVVYDDGELCRRFGRVAVDPGTVTTFEVMVILGKEPTRWLLSKMQSVLRNSGEPQTALKSTYKLVKNRLYRRNGSLSIHEGS